MTMTATRRSSQDCHPFVAAGVRMCHQSLTVICAATGSTTSQWRAVLTEPIGSGVTFVAERRLACRGSGLLQQRRLSRGSRLLPPLRCAVLVTSPTWPCAPSGSAGWGVGCATERSGREGGQVPLQALSYPSLAPGHRRFSGAERQISGGQRHTVAGLFEQP
jgi:hypothetical protein